MSDGLKLSVFFGDGHRTGRELTSDALMDVLAERELAASALCRGIEGFGTGRRIQTERFPELSTDLPLVAWAVDTRERIEALVEAVEAVLPRGLVTLEEVELVRAGGPADSSGGAAELTAFCDGARRASVREALDVLHAGGAAAAFALLGVDGTVHGRRLRAAFLSRRRHGPCLIVAIAARAALTAALPELERALERPVVSLEPVTLGGPPAPDGAGWHSIGVQARESTQLDGRALYTELTRRLREGGAAGATTVRAGRGFAGAERPAGDRLGTLGSHAPTYTVYADRAARVAELWPLIERAGAGHALLSARRLADYRVRGG